MKKRTFIAFFTALLSVISICSASTPEQLKGKHFTDFQVSQGNLDGTDVKFSDYVGKGKYVLVDFWASWCRPCRQLMPTLNEIYKKYGGEDFTILSVAVSDKPENSKAAIASEKMTWPQIINSQSIAAEIYEIRTIPSLILIDPDGIIVETQVYGKDIDALIGKYLKK